VKGARRRAAWRGRERSRGGATARCPPLRGGSAAPDRGPSFASSDVRTGPTVRLWNLPCIIIRLNIPWARTGSCFGRPKWISGGPDLSARHQALGGQAVLPRGNRTFSPRMSGTAFRHRLPPRPAFAFRCNFKAGSGSSRDGSQDGSRMRRLLLCVVLAAISGCAAGRPARPADARSGPAACSFDSECPGGSCRFGACSHFAPEPSTCAFDSQCPGGSCRFGTCSPFAPEPSACSFDSQCMGGSCDMGRCSPFPRPASSGFCSGGLHCSNGTCSGPDCR
jgi:hypothetical protein